MEAKVRAICALVETLKMERGRRREAYWEGAISQEEWFVFEDTFSNSLADQAIKLTELLTDNRPRGGFCFAKHLSQPKE